MTKRKKKRGRTRLFERAVKRLGLTVDPREAGYVLPSGKMLDFSGRRLGSRERGRRVLDHSEVDKQKFREKAAIRVSLFPGDQFNLDLGIHKEPTKQQWKTISSMFEAGRRSGPQLLAVDVYGKKKTAYGYPVLVHSEEVEDAQKYHLRRLKKRLEELRGKKKR